MKNILFIIGIFCFFLAFSMKTFGNEIIPTVNLATGSKKGVYFPIGKGIAEVANEANIKINVLNSEGSIENLKWLASGKVQLCLAQSDTVYNAYNGLNRFSNRNTNIRAIASLYTEAVHILIRRPLYIKKIGDFRGVKRNLKSLLYREIRCPVFR
ncbi:MAG: TAXI family TRAP transporter solute-binding subunit [Deferribacteres bacterium]|nr:TAXI family TRAP transporter solute-binding subunit [Deferribacteres bacterium]